LKPEEKQKKSLPDNLTEYQKSYRRGKEYAYRKVAPGQNMKSCGSENKVSKYTLAAKHGITPAAIRHDFSFYEAVNVLAREHGDATRDKILRGQVPLSRHAIIRLAQIKDATMRVQVLTGRKQLPKENKKGGSRQRTAKEIKKKALPGMCPSALQWKATLAYLRDLEDACVRSGVTHLTEYHTNAIRKIFENERDKHD
jgi:hypothetical protein